MTTALLSIKPEYVGRIEKGTKRFEFRRVRFSRPVSRVIVYATSPAKEIVLTFTVKSVKTGTPPDLWNRCGNFAGITKEDFDRYFVDVKTGIALEISNVKVLRSPIKPEKCMPGFRPPQSFRYLSVEDLSCLNL